MKFLLRILFFLIFTTSVSSASSNLTIVNWQENTRLTKTGKISEILIQGKIENLPADRVMTSFAIAFDRKRDIKIIKVICDSNLPNYSFSNNSLNINFPQDKPNNSMVSISFSYEEKYDKINEFFRQEAINIPSFAAGANAKVTVNFPDYFESITLNPNIVKNSNNFTYNKIVPKDGALEIVKLTPTQSVWDVVVKFKITSNGNSLPEKLNVSLPTYFQNAGQKIENQTTVSNLKPTKQNIAEGIRVFSFDNANEREIVIENRAKIYTGKNNRTQITRSPANYMKVDEEELILLSPILEKIKQDPRYHDLPLYAKIGKFVNEFIKYDISYTGKLPKIKEILQNPIGVCTEYSRLYNALARIAGIPSIRIDGAACDEQNECKGHAWNMIYYDNQWIEVDATWDLMSGAVSSSHVYFTDDDRREVAIQYSDDKGIVDSKIDFEMKKSF